MANPVFVRIAVNIPSVTGVFDYALPTELEGKIGAGHLVTVPFGRQTVQGVVLELLGQPSVAETKPILDLLDPLPVLTGAQLELAKQMAKSTLNPLAAIIDMMLPIRVGPAGRCALYIQRSAISDQQSAIDCHTIPPAHASVKRKVLCAVVKSTAISAKWTGARRRNTW